MQKDEATFAFLYVDCFQKFKAFVGRVDWRKNIVSILILFLINDLMYYSTRGKVVYSVHCNLNIQKLLKNLPRLETSTLHTFPTPEESLSTGLLESRNLFSS